MKYDFDRVVERKGTHCAKFDYLPAGNRPDAIPVWVADMDFACAPPIIEAIHKRADQEIFGYTRYNNEPCKNAITGWYQRRFGWEIDRDALCFCHGIVPALAFLIEILTKEGDGILIQKPVYYPFAGKILAHKRRVVNNALVRRGNTYEMDFEDLEKKMADPETKGMILCSPHNPVGRVWKEEELSRVVEIAKKYDKWIISDEIHCDLLRKGVKHTPLLKLAPEYKEKIITCIAPSKTFNIAGMQFSSIIIHDEELRKKWSDITANQFSLMNPNPIGMEAAIAAYNEGDEWVDQLCEYLDGNIAYVENYIKEHMPKAQVIQCEGTYLMWIDMKEYIENPYELERVMKQKAGIAFDEGYEFGEEGICFERINVATQRKVLEVCMKRMETALAEYGVL